MGGGQNPAAGSGSGIEAVPDDFHELLFAPLLGELRGLHASSANGRDSEAAKALGAQHQMWRDLLAGADMAPPDAEADRLFVSHTFLVVAARAVAGALGGPGGGRRPAAERIASDGFASWVREARGGGGWVERMHETAARHDWRSRPRDVFREMYESVVGAGLHKRFGEHYTPDWLAAMVVEEVCDDEWCEKAISAALASTGDASPAGTGVLDPACGSGGLLFHAARRLLSHPLLSDSSIPDAGKADAVAKLVVGIDIHPIAVEMARATLLRALPAAPSGGAGALRVWQGDSLGQPTSHLDASDADRLVVRTPGGASLALPMEFVWQEPAMGNLRALVAAAGEPGRALPDRLTGPLSDAAKAEMALACESLGKIIAQEGNGVWAWLIANQAAPHRLALTKVDRIVANPPWVAMSTIQEAGRKKRLEVAVGGAGLWPAGIGNRGAFDIAALFMRLCPQRYFAAGQGKSGWITSAGAISGGNWAAYNAARPDTLVVDMSEMKQPPFAGARSCVHYFGAGVVPGRVTMRPREGQKVGLRDGWPAAKEKIELSAAAAAPDAPSGYLAHSQAKSGRTSTGCLFAAGGRMLPTNLVVCDTTRPAGPGATAFTTRLSTRANPKWKQLGAQQGEVPDGWISEVVLQDGLLPYALNTPAKCVVPSGDAGETLGEGEARANPYWDRASRLYEGGRGGGAATPETLLGYLNVHNNLERLKSAPLEAGAAMVLHNASGQHLRAARSPGKVLVNDGVYWFMCPAAEAAYLIALLNARALAERFRAARQSDRDFHTHPWRKVPIPRFDPADRHHRELVGLCEEAEAVAAGVLPAVAAAAPHDASARIRRAVGEAGLEERLAAAIRHIIPSAHLI